MAQEGRWHFSQKPQRKRATARVEWRISWFFSSCGGVPLELLWRPQGPTNWGFREVQVHAESRGPLGIPHEVAARASSSSGVEAGTIGFLSRADVDKGISLGHPEKWVVRVSSHVVQY